MSHDSTPPTTVVQLTPPGRGAVTTLLVAGPRATHNVSALFCPAAQRPLSRQPLGKIVFGRWGGSTGEEIVCCRRDEQRVEIHCHGGHAAAAAITADLVAAGCEPASWQSWAQASRTDPIAANALVALAGARTERTALILLDQYHGALRCELDRVGGLLRAGQLPASAAALQELLARGPLGLRLVEPWKIVIAGQPNVGKSSLANALLGYDRSIVFDAPGTTRDAVTATGALDGWPVEFCDTAGLRVSQDPLEAAGVVLAEQRLATADAVVLVFASSQPWTQADGDLVEQWPGAILVHNKCDLPTAPAAGRPPGHHVSAITRHGLLELEQLIVSKMAPTAPATGAAVPFTHAQMVCLEQTLQAIRNEDAGAAHRILSRI